MAVPANTPADKSGARVRQRKISVKQPLTIFRQKDLPALDATNELEPSQVNHLNGAQRDPQIVETGVEKHEEEEVHLQQVINAAQKALLGKKKDEVVYIPTPDASKVWADAGKYYKDEPFREPESYIKFSASVEDTVGVGFNMDEEDEAFLKTLDGDLSELEFELVCDKLEKAIEARQPFLAVDPSNILGYSELRAHILADSGDEPQYLSATSLKERLAKELNADSFATLFDKAWAQPHRSVAQLLDTYGPKIYEHWRARKIARRGKPVHPVLKFEDPNANEKDNDNDPYVCFRRREFRQARKTRRADTLGAERVRMLQKSIHRARDLIVAISRREMMKLEQLEREQEVFRLRNETKAVKRAIGAKGDDHLFYPRKRRREKDDRDDRKEERKERPVAGAPSPSLSSPQVQPYVKLPPSKIPDMDLVTVSLVLKEKNETIKRAVLEKLRKRKEQDRGYANVTDDPYQPYFGLRVNANHKEISHVPYSSIAATQIHQVRTTNLMSASLRRLVEEARRPLPGVRTFRGNGELVPSRPFSHVSSLTSPEKPSYAAQLLQHIETNNFSAYTNGFGGKELVEDRVSEPVMRVRKRVGRCNRVFIDRGIWTDQNDQNGDGHSAHPDLNDKSSNESSDASELSVGNSESIPNVYDTVRRSRWAFDEDLSESQRGDRRPFDLDPSRLNCISADTQSIRFGSMLLSKSYGLLRESVQQRRERRRQAH